ncbi:MAG: DUF3102 domain-containing protein [Clostridiales bacterium]|nr:DUF3102 domain-containing protein [Clostridiales bacterium]
MNEQLSTTRTIGQVTQEINYLTAQAQRLVLGHAIEIGRRLTETKGMLPHGEWGRWLREEVHYSASSANNMMRIFDAYGSTQMGLFGPEANCQTFGNLEYSKALALLAVPEEEREQFATDVDAENISVRELKAQIKAREQERDEAENRAKGWEQKYTQATEREKNRAADLTDALTQAEKAQAAEKAAREDLEAKDTALKLANQRLAAHSAEVERLQKELTATVAWKGVEYWAFRWQSEILFCRAEYLTPAERKDGEIVQYTVRRSERLGLYIAVKEGLFLVGIVFPSDMGADNKLDFAGELVDIAGAVRSAQKQAWADKNAGEYANQQTLEGAT